MIDITPGVLEEEEKGFLKEIGTTAVDSVTLGSCALRAYFLTYNMGILIIVPRAKQCCDDSQS